MMKKPNRRHRAMVAFIKVMSELDKQKKKP
jgi:hypothetical protein